MNVDVRMPTCGARTDLGLVSPAPAKLMPALLAGLVGGLYAVVASVSYPALIFAGELQPYQSIGIGMALTGSAILAAVVGLTSSFPGTVATAESEPATILGVMAGSVAVGLGATAGADQAALLPTVVVLMALSSAILGLVFLILGTFRLANLVRYIPYPVIGGFLAGVGWLVISGAFLTLTGEAPVRANVGSLIAPEALVRWAPALIGAIVLLVLQRGRPHFLNLPGMVLAATLLFWAAAWLADTPMQALHDGHWLLGPFPDERLFDPMPQLAALAQVDWRLVLGQLPELGTLLILCLITLLLKASSLELMTRRDVDLNRELRSTGLANLLCGAFGGLAGYLSLSASSLAYGVGAPTRIIGLVVAFLCALTLLAGGRLLAYLPQLVVGILLLYVGLRFLAESVVDSYARLPPGEYAVLLAVFVGVVMVGVLEGVAFGIVAGVVLFVVNYGRIDVVRQAFSGATVRSNVERPENMRLLLVEHGEECHVLKLEGYIFFGTSNRLLARIGDRLGVAGQPPLRTLLLDFKRVKGVDSSALNSFTKLAQYAEQWDFTLVLTGLPPDIAEALHAAGIADGEAPRVRTFQDLDRGLEHSEEQLLARHRAEQRVETHPLEDQLRRNFPEAPEVDRLLHYMEQETWEERQLLIRQGDASRDLFFIEAGRVSIELDIAPGQALRLRTVGAGTAVGEMALYLGLPRSASVVADQPTCTYRLTAAQLASMKRRDPQVAALFHEFMARTLAARLADNNRQLEAYAD